MNIYTASLYLNKGYKIRRPSWETGDYICKTYGVVRKSYAQFDTAEKCASGDWHPQVDDLISDDWELITEDSNVV